MIPEQKVFGRPPVRQERILRQLRQRIVDGEFGPGDRLPSIRQLEYEYDASRVTVQRIVRRLSQDGFTTAHVGRGTHVAKFLPHLNRYGLVFPASHEEGWTLYFEALEKAASLLAEEDEGSLFETFEGINNAVISEDFNNLLYDITNHCIAGMIFPVVPYLLLQTEVWQDDVPRVVVGPRKPWRGASVINLDNDLLQAKALDYLKNQGKKRIAVVCNISNTRPFEEMWQHCNQMMQERGLKTKPYWIQGVNLHAAGWTTNLIHLLFSDANQEQPDGLMILDDNLVEPVAVGVKRAGIKVSEDLTIVAHTNFPEISNAAVPLKRIGFDMCELVRTAQRIISCQRRNPDAEPEKVVLKPVFEHELTAACN